MENTSGVIKMNRSCNCNYGKSNFSNDPMVLDIHCASIENCEFRSVLSTGEHMQITLMDIPVGESIGLERHEGLDQFLCIQSGQGMILMGDCKERLRFRKQVCTNSGIMIPCNTWHNLVNTGDTPLKLFSVYSSPVHSTKDNDC